MKRNCILTIVLIVASIVIATVSFEACKKEVMQPTPINNIYGTGGNNNQQIIHDAKFIVNQIKTFKKQLEKVQMHSGQKDVEYISVDSAIWNIEALLNSSFGFPDEVYVKKVLQSTTFNIVVNYDNMVSMEDVYRLYNQIVESVRNIYANDGFTENKALMAVVVSAGEKNGGNQNVDVKVISGRTAVNLDPPLAQYINGPFHHDDCWCFGEYGGSCSDSTIPYDAAEAIEDTVNYYYGWSGPLPAGCRNIYVNTCTINLIGNEYFDNANNEYYIFYKMYSTYPPNFYYFSGNELNKYYRNEVKVITELIPNDPYFVGKLPENPVFMQIDIQGINNYVEHIMHHENYITYGTKYLLDIDDIGEAVDLLDQ